MRVSELDQRLAQFASDIAREQQQTVDADAALERLATEDVELKDEIRSRVEQRSGVDERVAEAEAVLAAAERTFAELTTALADLTARRRQIEANVRSHRERVARLDQEIAQVDAGIAQLAAETSGFGDLDVLAGAVESAQDLLGQSEYTVQEAEATLAATRQTLEASRAPLAEATCQCCWTGWAEK